MNTQTLLLDRLLRSAASALPVLALLSLLASPWSNPAQAAVKRAELGLHWHLKLFGPDGKEVPRKLLDEGIRRDLVVGGEYRVTGRAPPQIMKRYKKISGLEIAFESRPDNSPDTWTVHNHVRLDRNGRFDKKFIIHKQLHGKRHYRVRVIPPDGYAYEAGAATVGTTAASDTTASQPLTATGNSQFVVELVSNISDDLVIYVPTNSNQVAGDGTPIFNEGSFDLPSGETRSLIYTNAPPGSNVVFKATKKRCFLGCSVTYTRWDHQVSGYTPCSQALQPFESGKLYTATLKPKFGLTTAWDGFLEGPGVGTNNVCSFELNTNFNNWFENNPVEGAVFIYMALYLVAILVLASIATFGGVPAGIGVAAGSVYTGAFIGEEATLLTVFLL